MKGEELEMWLDVTEGLRLLSKECGFLFCGHGALLDEF